VCQSLKVEHSRWHTFVYWQFFDSVGKAIGTLPFLHELERPRVCRCDLECFIDRVEVGALLTKLTMTLRLDNSAKPAGKSQWILQLIQLSKRFEKCVLRSVFCFVWIAQCSVRVEHHHGLETIYQFGEGFVPDVFLLVR
jgi:hypothetical protein